MLIARLRAEAVFYIFYILMGLIIASAPPSAVSAKPASPGKTTKAQSRDAVPGEYIVKMKTNTTRNEAASTAANVNGKIKGKQISARTWVLKVDPRSGEQKILRKIKSLPNVEYIEPNGYVRALYTPNDPLYRAHRQWNFRKLVVCRAWNKSKGRGAIVAVVDTGVTKKLSDFNRTKFRRGYDFVNGDRYPFDDNGHGSHVAGTIAQSTNNGRGVAGIAFKATIVPVKVLDRGGYGTFSDVAKGIRWAANRHVHVINLSLGSSLHSRTLEEAVRYARRKNVVIVAAAGNGGTDHLSYPAAYKWCMAVTATDYNNNLAWYSSWGSGVGVSAPGGDTSADLNSDGRPDGILQQTTRWAGSSRGRYKYYQGTSMAAPHVSAIAALVRAQGNRSASHIIDAVRFSARDFGAPGYDRKYGWGFVSAYGAVRYRVMRAPKFIRPTAWTKVGAGSQLQVKWDRMGKKWLKYQLQYSDNASDYGPVQETFESGTIGSGFKSFGDKQWQATNSTASQGSYSARSGDIGNSETSGMAMIKRIYTKGTITFSYKVSSESNYDYLDFYIDGSRKVHRSGNVGWTTVAFPVSIGEHRFYWEYTKDYSISSGSDAAYVDNIEVTNVSQADWHNIVNPTKTGAYSKIWTVPGKTGNDYRLRIRAFNGLKYGVWIFSPGRFIVE